MHLFVRIYVAIYRGLDHFKILICSPVLWVATHQQDVAGHSILQRMASPEERELESCLCGQWMRFSGHRRTVFVWICEFFCWVYFPGLGSIFMVVKLSLGFLFHRIIKRRARPSREDGLVAGGLRGQWMSTKFPA